MGNYGKTDIGASTDALAADTEVAACLGYNLFGDTIARTAYFYLSLVSGYDVKFALFSNSGSPALHVPDTLLGQTAAVTGTSGAKWYSADFLSPINISDGLLYWIGVINQTFGMTLNRDSVGSDYAYYEYAGSYGSGFSDPYPHASGTRHSFYFVSAYVVVDADLPDADVSGGANLMALL
jgi:hypothetical protein